MLDLQALAREKTVIIFRLGSIGDTVISLPCLHAIAKATPNARRLVLTNFPVNAKAAPLEAILGPSGLIHGTMKFPAATRSPRQMWLLFKELRRSGAKTLFFMTERRGVAATWRDVLFFKLCGLKQIIGAPVTRALNQSRHLDSGDIEPECERLARCFSDSLSIDLNSQSSWDLNLTTAEKSRAAAILDPFNSKPFLAINMGGKLARQQWPVTHWLELVAKLRARLPGYGLLIIGAPDDFNQAARVAERWHAQFCVNACGQLSPRESAAAVAHCRLFIGHDSGPMHLAAAVGARCVGLFGNNNPPRRWHPYGRDNVAIHRMSGIENIGVTEVEDVIFAQLAKPEWPVSTNG